MSVLSRYGFFFLFCTPRLIVHLETELKFPEIEINLAALTKHGSTIPSTVDLKCPRKPYLGKVQRTCHSYSVDHGPDSGEIESLIMRRPHRYLSKVVDYSPWSSCPGPRSPH